MAKIPERRFLRLHQIIGRQSNNGGDIDPLVPVSKTTWYQGIKDGRFPKPCRFLGNSISVWRTTDIAKLIGEPIAKKGQ